VGGAYAAGRWDMLLIHALGGLLRRGAWAPMAEREGGGVITGSVGAFLVLETRSHAAARGARGLAEIASVATGAARRTGEDTARASAAGLAGNLRSLLRPGYAVVSGASGAAGPARKKRLPSPNCASRPGAGPGAAHGGVHRALFEAPSRPTSRSPRGDGAGGGQAPRRRW
jgi:hypothetical protein